jgi:hypothetical protein
MKENRIIMLRCTPLFCVSAGSFAESAKPKNLKPVFDFLCMDGKITGWIEGGYYRGESIIFVKCDRVS